MTLPPLPPPDTHCWDEDTSKDVWSHSADQMRAYAEQAVAAERERCAQMVAGKPFVDTGGAQARRGPSSVGTWHERSPCGNLMSAMAEALRKHGITG